MVSPPSDQVSQLLGLAFAGADLLAEVDAKGAITVALGAAKAITGYDEAALVGKRWTSLVAEAESDVLEALMHGIGPGERRGPLRLTLNGVAGRPGRQVSISAFMLPGNRSLSVALSLASAGGADFVRTKEGLVPAEAFEATTSATLAQAAQAGAAVRLDLIELSGLADKAKAMAPADSALMRKRIAATLRADSYAGVGASEVAPGRFALIRPATGANDRLLEQLKVAAGVKPKMAALPLKGGAGSLDVRAIRFALDKFIQQGADAAAGGFKGAVEQTVRDSDRFKTMLKARSFNLVYQPVVGLADERVHHFEALTRFDDGVSPAEMILLAEELDLMLDFDIAVVEMVADALRAHPDVGIAANLSAGSLANPRFIEALLALTDDRAFRRRLLLEITETKRLDDLETAARSIDALREAGFLVCLDDFGAGAASLDYLRALSVDFVKFDGRFIRDLAEGGRDAVLLKHLVKLCEELGVQTVAEVVETRATADVARKLGVVFGQGWVFGKPGPTLSSSQTRPSVAAPRRSGMVETWG